METCVRGFSFMPDTNVDVVDLKYVESEELEKTWKTTRRERLKQQELKIWEEFVKEEDIVGNISRDDPYQFIDQLPEACIKELLDLELQKMKQEIIEEAEADESDVDEPNEVTNQHVVTFADDVEKECEMLNIFDDDKDDDVSGPEEEVLNDSIGSPCTVRERQVEDDTQLPVTKHDSLDKMSCKSSEENVTDMIESNIYSAKIKELKIKINEELLNILDFLEKEDFRNVDPVDAPKVMKRAAEFSARFSRVHAYALHTQLSELERAARSAGPARHTRARFTRPRLCALLTDLRAALQAFRQSAARAGAAPPLRALSALARRAAAAPAAAAPAAAAPAAAAPAAAAPAAAAPAAAAPAAAAPAAAAPAAAAPAAAAPGDAAPDIQATCDKLDETFEIYTQRMTEYFNSIETSSASSSKKFGKSKGKKKSIGTWSKTGIDSYTLGSRLSMYSMDTRTGFNSKSSNSKEITSTRLFGAMCKKQPTDKAKDVAMIEKEEAPVVKTLRKSPASIRRLTPVVDTHIHTLVESQPCTSSHISPEGSPISTPKSTRTPRVRKETTPRKITLNNKKQLNISPRNAINTKLINSPKLKNEISTRKFENTIEPSRNNTVNDATSFVNKTEIRDMKMNEQERAWSLDVNANSEEDVTRDGESTVKEKKCEKDRNKVPESGPASVEVTKLLRQLCGGDAAGSRNERTAGAKNAQLFCVTGSSPRQPSTPQLLRILEETIQKKTPKALFPKTVVPVKDAERYRMSFNIPERVSENLFQYRTKFVQHMLTSTMYANSDIGKPWEKIGSVSEQIIDELLLNCAKEMELDQYIKNLYEKETC